MFNSLIITDILKFIKNLDKIQSLQEIITAIKAEIGYKENDTKNSLKNEIEQKESREADFIRNLGNIYSKIFSDEFFEDFNELELKTLRERIVSILESIKEEYRYRIDQKLENLKYYLDKNFKNSFEIKNLRGRIINKAGENISLADSLINIQIYQKTIDSYYGFFIRLKCFSENFKYVQEWNSKFIQLSGLSQIKFPQDAKQQDAKHVLELEVRERKTGEWIGDKDQLQQLLKEKNLSKFIDSCSIYNEEIITYPERIINNLKKLELSRENELNSEVYFKIEKLRELSNSIDAEIKLVIKSYKELLSKLIKNKIENEKFLEAVKYCTVGEIRDIGLLGSVEKYLRSISDMKDFDKLKAKILESIEDKKIAHTKFFSKSFSKSPEGAKTKELIFFNFWKKIQNILSSDLKDIDVINLEKYFKDFIDEVLKEKQAEDKNSKRVYIICPKNS